MIETKNQVMKTGCCNTKEFHRTESTVICINARCENYLTPTTIEKGKSKWKNPIAVSVFIFYLLFSLDDFGMESKEKNTVVWLELSEQDVPLNMDNLQKELKKQQVICTREVMAQIKIESASLTSFLLKRTNNMLGMRYPFKRVTTACGIYIPSKDTIIYGGQEELRKYRSVSNYAVYKSWKDGIADYKLWQENNFNTSERYLKFLGKVYAEDSLYVKKIKAVAALNDRK